MAERAEDGSESLRTHADGGVEDLHPELLPGATELHPNGARFGKLEPVSYQVEEDLTQAHRISENMGGEIGVDLSLQNHPRLGPGRAKDGGRLLDLPSQIYGHGLQGHLLGLEFGEIENIVDEREESIGAIVDRVDQFLLIVVEFGVDEQL